MSTKLVTASCYSSISSSSGSSSSTIRYNDFSFKCFECKLCFVGRTHEVIAGVEVAAGVVVAVGLQEGNIHNLKVLNICEY